VGGGGWDVREWERWWGVQVLLTGHGGGLR